MNERHVTALVTRYVHGQLSPAQCVRVLNHVRFCSTCRALLAREERIAAEMSRELPSFGHANAGQLAHIWTETWHEVSVLPAPRFQWKDVLGWSGGVLLAVFILLIVALPVLAERNMRVEAAPPQPRPLNTASPTPGAIKTDEARAHIILPSVKQPDATLAFVNVKITPAPVPQVTISPVMRGSGDF